jgi:hypothetical protein
MRLPCFALFTGLALAACSDTQGPALKGPAFFKIAIDGQPVSLSLAQAGCGDYGLILDVGSLAAVIPNADYLEIRIADMRRPRAFVLADAGSGRFAQTHFLGIAGLSFATDSVTPGHFTVTGVDFADSVLAGTFSFRLVSLMSSTTGYDATGSFRLPFGQVFTVDHPDGTTCQAPPN